VAGREKIATDERVAEVAEQLVRDGADPAAVSYRQVAAVLGGGSATTITAALRRWRAGKGIGEPKRRGRPSAVRVSAAGGVEGLKRFLQAKLDRLLARRATLEGELQSLDAEIAQVRGSIDEGVGELKALIDKYSLSPADLGEMLTALQKSER
jgi:hypothetical protein